MTAQHTRRAALAIGAGGALAATAIPAHVEHEPLLAMWNQWVEANERSIRLDDAAARAEAHALEQAILDAAPVTLAGLVVQSRFFAITMQCSIGGTETEQCLTHLERLERMSGLEPDEYVRSF